MPATSAASDIDQPAIEPDGSFDHQPMSNSPPSALDRSNTVAIFAKR